MSERWIHHHDEIKVNEIDDEVEIYTLLHISTSKKIGALLNAEQVRAYNAPPYQYVSK